MALGVNGWGPEPPGPPWAWTNPGIRVLNKLNKSRAIRPDHKTIGLRRGSKGPRGGRAYLNRIEYDPPCVCKISLVWSTRYPAPEPGNEPGRGDWTEMMRSAIGVNEKCCVLLVLMLWKTNTR